MQGHSLGSATDEARGIAVITVFAVLVSWDVALPALDALRYPFNVRSFSILPGTGSKPPFECGVKTFYAAFVFASVWLLDLYSN